MVTGKIMGIVSLGRCLVVHDVHTVCPLTIARHLCTAPARRVTLKKDRLCESELGWSWVIRSEISRVNGSPRRPPRLTEGLRSGLHRPRTRGYSYERATGGNSGYIYTSSHRTLAATLVPYGPRSYNAALQAWTVCDISLSSSPSEIRGGISVGTGRETRS